jgi:gliding motility-associated-like protein
VATVVPIRVSDRPRPDITVSPSDTVCVNNTINIKATFGTGRYATSSGCQNGNLVWGISPATGYTVVNGSLGNDNGQNNVTLWTSGTENLNVRFTTPGIYTIRLRLGNPVCGVSDTVRTICVNPQPVAAINLDKTEGCAPLVVNASNSSAPPNCGPMGYNWSVSYSPVSGCSPSGSNFTLLNGTTLTSAAPVFQFNNPGRYRISLVVNFNNGSCTSPVVSREVLVKAKPTATLAFTSPICQNNTINPTAVVNACEPTSTATYAWTFTGGSPASSTLRNPGTITYNSNGTFNVSLAVTNDCGTTTVTNPLQVNPAADVVVPANDTACVGETMGPFNFSSSLGGTSFTWTNNNPLIGLPASGSGNIGAFTAQNSTGVRQVATITVRPVNSCAGSNRTFVLVVEPRPAAPATAPVNYCVGDIATPLTATASSGHVLKWYTTATGGTALAAAPTPATTTAGTFTWYVSQTNSSTGCEGPRAAITVTVTAVANISATATNPTSCGSATGTIRISGMQPNTNYVLSYTFNGVPQSRNINTTAAGEFVLVGLTAGTYANIRVGSGNCPSNTVGPFNLSDPDPPATPTAANNGPICSGSTLQLSANSSTPGVTYSWTGPNGFSSQQQNPSISNAPASAAGTYTVRAILAGCISASASTTVVITPRAVVNAGTAQALCNASSATLAASPTGGAAGVWTVVPPATATFGNANSNVTTVTGLTPGQYRFVWQVTNGACGTLTDTVLINNLPPVAGNAIAPANTNLCSGQSVTLTGSTPTGGSGSYTYTWQQSTNGTTWTNVPGGTNPNLTVSPTQNSFYRRLINSGACADTSNTAVVNVQPAAVVNAGTAQTLCNASSATLAASPTGGAAGVWTVVPPATATFGNANSNVTTVTGLTPGQYRFVWQVTNGACGTLTDTVLINNLPPVAGNTIAPANTNLCSGQSVTLTGSTPTGGSGSYTYTWQQSTNGTTWTNVPGGTNPNLTVSPTQNLFYRRLINSGACADTSNNAVVNVQAAITNNSISSDQTICINTVPALINGSTPTGGGAGVVYSWEQSTDNGASWQPISGASSASYQPGSLSQTTQYRRLVSTTLCSGPQSSISNVVTITVNPNAQLLLNTANLTGCAPFRITSANISVTHLPALNSTYQWYVNNTLVGTGLSFPGHTIAASGQSAAVKVIAISRFGCLPDSATVVFNSVANPAPSFTLSDTVGCGPLSITINNTTPNAGSFTYRWDFGTGQTSTAAQPGTILFPVNPNRGDTVYTVTLFATAGCDTLTASQSIRVRSRPRALFTPSQSIGCSPMTVTFNNNSAGSNASFVWDFGDGSPRINSNAATLSHTFFTGVLDTFYVNLYATNDCGTDTATFAIVVNPNRIRLDMAVNGNELNGCAPHTARFINNTTGANRFLWNFDDGSLPLITTRGFDTITHVFANPGTYTVRLEASNGCSDTSTTEVITVVAGPRVSFTVQPAIVCLGDSIRITNTSTEALAWRWTFGDGSTSNLRDPQKQYTSPGTYRLVLYGSKVFPQGFGCSDSAVATVTVTAPTGTLNYRGGYYCQNQSIQLEVLNSNGNRFIFYPGNGDSVVSSTPRISYRYPAPGRYLPAVRIIAGNCQLRLAGTDSVLVDRIQAGFRYVVEESCGSSVVRFTDTSNVFFGRSSISWRFGDGTTASAAQVSKTFTAGGNFRVVMRIVSNSGCEDSVIFNIDVPVQPIPSVAIVADTVACTGSVFNLLAQTNTPGTLSYQWNLGNNQTASGAAVSTRYFNTGTYNVQLIARTAFGCADTVTRTVVARPSPMVSAGSDVRICLGQSTTLQARGAGSYLWSPQQGLSCADCASPVAAPQQTTSYVVTGTNQFGCTATDTVLVSVTPPLQMTVSPNDTICFPQNEAAQLFAQGASRYQWQPAVGLSATDVPNPIAQPTSTTTYRVVGFDNDNCFTDTGFVTVAVGYLPTVELGNGGTVTAGTQIPFNPAITNGPIRRYTWTPTRDLSCSNCATPIATINNDVLYQLTVENIYGCLASDTIRYTVLCKPNEQVYVPNAFSPDGDGINDILMVRGKGLSQVKSFIIFNRWGQVVFEAQNFLANDPSHGWNGMMRNTNTKAAQDVYVYRVEAVCTAGGTFVQTGNVTLFYMR